MDEACHQTASFMDRERALLRHQIGARWDMIHRINALKTASQNCPAPYAVIPQIELSLMSAWRNAFLRAAQFLVINAPNAT